MLIIVVLLHLSSLD